jgi:hypothetical protein
MASVSPRNNSQSVISREEIHPAERGSPDLVGYLGYQF